MEVVLWWLRLLVAQIEALARGRTQTTPVHQAHESDDCAASMSSPGNMAVDSQSVWSLLYAGVNFSLAGTGGPGCMHYISLAHRAAETALLVPLFVYVLLWSYRRIPMPAPVPVAPAVRRSDSKWSPRRHGQLQQRHAGGVQLQSTRGDNMVKSVPLCCPVRDEVDDKAAALPLADTFAFVCSVLRGANGRRCLLAVYCCVFGCELGYKLCSRTAIYLLNPCHLLTAAQIAMLALDDHAPHRHAARNLIYRVHVYAVAGSTLAMAFPVLNTRLRVWSRCVYWCQSQTL